MFRTVSKYKPVLDHPPVKAPHWPIRASAVSKTKDRSQSAQSSSHLIHDDKGGNKLSCLTQSYGILYIRLKLYQIYLLNKIRWF